MSCKYCELKMRPIDEDTKVLKGESWGDEHGEGGYIGQMYDDKFRMLVSYDAGYACTAVDDIKYCPFCGTELTMPKGPLIKDENDPERAEKIRKAIQTWAEVLHIDRDNIKVSIGSHRTSIIGWQPGLIGGYSIDFPNILKELHDGMQTTITELCGDEE